MGLSHSPSIVTSGLVLCLDAANPRSYPGSGTVWTDICGNGNAISLVNGPSFSSLNRGGIVLDAVDDYLSGGLPINASGNFTYEVWLKYNTNPGLYKGSHILGVSNRGDGLIAGASGFNTHITVDSNGAIRVFTFNGGGSTDYDTGFVVSSGEIFQVGFIHNSGVSKAGVKNGIVSSFQAAWSTQTFGYMLLGGVYTEGGYFSQCSAPSLTLYNVKMYNRALSATEVTQNFEALRGRYGI